MKLWFQLEDGQRVLKECRLDRVLGRMCVSRSQLHNNEMRAPTGTRFKIRDYEHHHGWALELPEACKCCGLSGRVTGVHWLDIVIDGPVPKPPTQAAIEAARTMGGDDAADALIRKWKRPVRYYDPDE